MNQPPKHSAPPQWRRPAGVAPGTWDYVNQRTIADHYDAFVADTPLCRLDRELLSEWLPGTDASNPQLVLDLGCGSGRTAIPLAAAGYDVIGIDLSESMLQVVREKSEANRDDCGSVGVVRANLVDLDCLASQSADHAVCLFSTLGMIQGRRQMLSHVARIVRPGGRLMIHVHNRWAAVREPAGCRGLAKSWLASVGDADCEFGDSVYAYRGIETMFMHRFSKRELRRDLITSGWQVVRIDAVSIDGSRTIQAGWLGAIQAGGYLAVASRDA
jgi:SAM-dependent methyltransferase